MGVQRHAATALPPGKRLVIHCMGDWVGPRVGLDGCGKSRPHRDSVPDRPVRSDFDCSSFDLLNPANKYGRVAEVAGSSESYLSSFNVIHALHISPYFSNKFISEGDILGDIFSGPWFVDLFYVYRKWQVQHEECV